MSSWVQLLLALLAPCLRFSIAEEDALPAALVELVRKSPISSLEDLQLLLLTDSIDAQPAQQALCKVRTEVVEVTRAMLDRSNANFLLWPPCVEVQRCSGCCNTKSLQCLPIVTHTRYLQVMKIEYVNKRPTYAKAVVSFVDHVECRCQPTPHSPGPKKKSSRKQHSHLHRNKTLSQEQVQGQV
ncbi:platelet-derived growth factor subunit B, partial [Acanthochromis polyacanthus]|uniref:platelet-derived growth factor subunit B n=1 Tax=Acanthochromis polyacanthus TaxID=80966 RepID=UPI0022341C36